MRTISLLFLICPSIFLFSQDEIDRSIQGEWIQKGSRFDLNIGDGYGEIFDAKYVRMSFQNGNVLISYSPFELKNLSFRYFIDLDTLEFGISKFILVMPSINQLRLQGIYDTAAIVLNRIIPRKPSIYRIDLDTVYQATIQVSPRFNGNLRNFLLNGGLIDFPGNKGDRAINIKFTLQSNGQITNATVTSAHAKWRNNLFKKTLIKSQSRWIPPSLNGKPISTSVELNVIRKGGRTLDRHSKAERYFARGFRAIETKPDLSLQLITMAQYLEPKNAKYYFYRAICYYVLLNEEKMCQDIAAAQEICPFLPLYLIDKNMGIEVRCIRN